MGGLLQVLLRVLPAPNPPDSDTEVEVEAQVESHWACAICGDVRVEESAHQNKHDDSGGVGR